MRNAGSATAFQAPAYHRGMWQATLSRRRFTSSLAAAGGALVAGLKPSLAHASRTKADARDLIQLNSNENPYGPSPKALEAMSGAQVVAGRYPDDLEEEMLEALAEHHGIAATRIVMGCGSSEILRLADAAFLAPGRTAIAAEPTFEAVLEYAGVHGGEAVKVPLDERFRHDLGRMAAACDARTALVYVCNPNNPTGSITPAARLRAFLRAVPPATTVVVDEAYHHYADAPEYESVAPLVGTHANLVVARTFSKVHGMAGLRLGYAIAQPPVIKKLAEHAAWDSANIVAIAGARASLADTAYVAEGVRRNAATKAKVVSELGRLGYQVVPSQTNFILIALRKDAKPVIDALRDRGVLVGRLFPALPQHLRVTIGTPAQMDRFVDAFAAVVA